MPMLRLASAPKMSATTTANPIPKATPHHGFHPRLRPFVFPFVVALPSTKPAIPKIDTCASDTMPPYAERKIRLAAAIPRKSICVSNWPTQYPER